LMIEGVAGPLNVGKLGGEVGFSLRQAFDVGSSRLVVPTDLVDGSVGICDCVLESGARRAFVPDLLLEFRLAHGRVPQGARRVGQLSFNGVAGCLDVGQSRGEVGLKLRQAFDVGNRCLMVVMYLFQRDFGIAQPLCEAVAIGHRLRQRTIELCPLPRELGRRRRQCGVVPLMRIAQGGVPVCECVRCLGELMLEGVAGPLNVGELGGEVPDLLLEFRLVRGGVL
jgi:hypothetical protein